MTKPPRIFRSTDVVGIGRLATDAIVGLTDVVEAVHGHIALSTCSLDPTLADVSTSGITGLVYNSSRGVNRLVNQTFTRLGPLMSPAAETEFSPKRVKV